MVKTLVLINANAEKRVTLIPTFFTKYGKPKIPHDSIKYIGGPIPLLTLTRSPVGGGWI